MVDFLVANWHTVLSILAFVVALVWAIIECVKKGKLTELKNAIVAGIQKAEALSENGATKKELVLCWAIETARALGIKKTKDQLSEEIETLVGLTKAVNAREKDKVAAENVVTEETVEVAEKTQAEKMNSVLSAMFGNVNNKK